MTPTEARVSKVHNATSTPHCCVGRAVAGQVVSDIARVKMLAAVQMSLMGPNTASCCCNCVVVKLKP